VGLGREPGVMSPTSTSNRAAPEGPMPLSASSPVPVSATSLVSPLFAAFTGMPELIALLHSFVGLAAVLVD
jgi:hypothetical protein